MNYAFAPDLDLSKEVVGVKGIEDGDGIVYAKDYSCAGCILNDCYKDRCLLSRSVSLCRRRLAL